MPEPGGAEGAPGAKLGLGFTEEMAQELRNSTEELDFQDPTDVETKQRRRKLHQQQAVNKYELDMQGGEGKERKDSACSDTGLLYISGRTSRLSSIGSAASGGSAASHASGASGVSHLSAASHLSGASHLSATSQLSRASRCSSPHKMLLETSFCGPKPIPTVSLEAEYPPKESVEATLLARKTDPTGAVLPLEEHKNMVNGKTSVSREKSKSTRSSSSTLSVGRESSVKSKSCDRAAKSQSSREGRSSSFHSKSPRSDHVSSNVEIIVPQKADEEKTTPTHRKEPPRLPPDSGATFISLHDDDEQPVQKSRAKSKTLPLEADSRIISLHGDDEPPVKSESKRTLQLDGDSRIISLHRDEPPPPKAPIISTSKRKTPSRESSTKTLPARKPEPKSISVSTSKRKQPIKYEGDQILIPLTGDETPIVLSGGKLPETSKTTLEENQRIIPLHGSPEETTDTTSIMTKTTPIDKDSRIIPLKGDEIEIHTTSRKIKESDHQPKVVHTRKKPTIPPDASAVIIPLHGDEEIVALEIETDRPSSPEYGIYIPLKGPEIADYSKKSQAETKPKITHETTSKPKKLDVRPKGKTSKASPLTETKPSKKEKKDEELVKFVSLHDDESQRQPIKVEITEEILDDRYDLKPHELRSKSASPVFQQAEIQSIQHTYFKPDDSSAYSRKHSTSSCRSPEFEGVKVKPATLDLTSIVRPSRPVQSLTQLTRDESRTPSPATSISRGSLFRRSSESSSSTKSRASVSEFRSRKDSKNKSVFSSLFKKGSRDSIRRKSESSEKTTPMDPRFTKVEFTFNQQDRGGEDSIIIPLHSPDSTPAPLVLACDMPPEIDVLIHPPEMTAETVQSISEVVAAIEELKSQPLVSPVPTPISSSPKPKEEDTIAPAKPEPKVEVTKSEEKLVGEEEIKGKLLFEDNLNVEVSLDQSDLKKEETENFKQKQELEVQSSLEVDISPRSETSGGSTKTQLEAPLEKQESDKKSDSETVKTVSEERRSSESEPDSDAVPIPADHTAEDDHERKGLFHQPESVEDELPYVPTTLPLERPVAHPIIPIKQRVAEKTCPIDRPRSTTPINPTTLDDYVSSPHEDPQVSAKDKMQIVLPRTESLRESRSKSPHKSQAKPWTHFAEQGLQSPRELRRVSSPSPPPPLPPRTTATWVCFDEVPERRRTPKRITTLPSTQPSTAGVVYSYVNPEECSCECHESQGRVNGAQCSESGAHCQYKDPYRT